ncbi:asparagine synthase (glutamine-hydrolyzing) [Effusibacillus lacus]|uniref:asparagine synthase (glutamine-hydrolyzing) n=1 Tax=Effusibacillus lacus TaxID=1348429 RepID=A0A292YQV8_9BACL|nr:asparagine synthase (glutamine-hydrolyzing) [Effusibacillus lacus]TCS72571.1 asparagine synthase (glutamine-hydrolysing) [Effusibacillus lacus]GAX90870.1 asparagine synthetase B [Effusibacillus lacus]
MCGICGMVTKDGRPADQTVLERMTDMIVHRGPDDTGVHFDRNVGLGFRRLSIIDLETGHQPMSNEDGSVWIVFNGEIYNYKEIRRELHARGHKFATESDTEVIVHLYEEKGPDCVKELRGMFGFAIWDSNKNLLLVARDHFGIKPIYYTETADTIAFGSEIKSLLAVPGVQREVNLESFWNYLTFQYAPDPLTMFKGIHKLPAAHYMIVKDGKISLQRYWEVSFEEGDKPLSYYIEGTRDILRNSVKAHMNSDVPRGAFLSSGVDSSTIVALLKELEQVKTFTVGFEGAGGQSEIEYARETARILGTEHRDTVISAKEYLDVLPKLMHYQDEPVADPAAIALYFVSELASQYITVVLSGEGADEVFGGYTIYREPLSLRMFDYLPPSMRRSLGDFAKFLPEGMKGRSFMMRGSKTVQERFVGNAFIFDEEMKEQFVHYNPDQLGLRRPMDITGAYYDRIKHYDDVTKMQFLDFHTWLTGDILMKADKMTMANSLELRVPFLDKEVFEFASKIPMKYRMMNGTTKYVLREAVKDILPKEVAERPKLGFPVPTRKWLKNEFYGWAKDLIDASPVEHLINKKFVLQLLEDHKNNVRDNSRKIWTVMIFMLWHQVYVEQSVRISSEVSPNVQLRRTRGKQLVGATE